MRQIGTARRAGQPAITDEIQAIGEAMARYGIAPLPRNYELLHEVFYGANGELKSDFAALGPRLRQADLDDLGLHYRLPGHCALAAHRGQSQASDILHGMKQQLAASMAGKRAFSRSLDLTSRSLRETGTSLADSLRAVEALQAALTEIMVSETALDRMLDQGAERLDHIQRGLQALDASSLQDKLTRLPNRIAFARRLDGLYQPGETPARSALVLVDVDDFSRINDAFGQRAGNRLLKQLGVLLRKSIKKSDFVARIGGDEFALLFSEVDQADVVAIAGRLRTSIAEELLFATSEPGESDHLTVSIGVALSARATSAVELQAQAQAALASAKADTRHAIKLHPG